MILQVVRTRIRMDRMYAKGDSLSRKINHKSQTKDILARCAASIFGMENFLTVFDKRCRFQLLLITVHYCPLLIDKKPGGK